MLLSYPSGFIKKVYPSLIWKMNTKHKEIFLTFDDGPTPEVTSDVLKLLSKYNAKASFFCLGKNIQENPDLFKEIVAGGHVVGNHTYNHKNGWKNTTTEFLHDVSSFQEIYESKLFRPPYGRIKSSQIKLLKKRYDIIMWSVLTQDYDQSISPEKCAGIACSNWENGSIIVFHDSVKAKVNMFHALEKVLKKAQTEGWRCSALFS
ncbi:MAG: peptidoglycan/xylan/chitin deacetylase (PgdA/CDA1 family) [Vicingaceae bacterium]|jgi:peptidoglycan/xylan/chitin deacetylase (PgdA/CDA1 family)